MRFRSKYNIHKEENRKLIFGGFYRPTAKNYRDIIEDYLRISRERRNNTLAISKLQIHILADLIAHQKILDNLEEQLISNKENIEYVKQEIFANELIIKSLKDIADGIAYRYFGYDRALLHHLGTKPDTGPIRPNQGLLSEINVWSEAFDYGQAEALINGITNVVRIGDVTIFYVNGEVEFIEVKSSKSMRGKERRARLVRQKEKLEETVNFFNTGITEFDGQTLSIWNTPIVPKNRFDLAVEVIKKAKDEGLSYGVIEDYLIIECGYFEKVKTPEEIISYFEAHTEPIKEEWRKQGDFLFGPIFFHERLDFSHNLVPISIWPLDSNTCADLMMGKLTFVVTVNISKIQREFEKHGWAVEKSIFNSKSIDDDSSDYLITIKKDGLFIKIPPGILGKNIFEFLSPDTLVETFDWLYASTSKDNKDLVLLSYEKEQEIWD